MSGLPVEQAYRLADRPEEQRWLVTGLWSEQAVGIVGGEPKCCKSFLALDLAVAVASGTPCLRRFPVPQPGRVLLYAAEDALHVVRRRLEGICAAAGLDLQELDVHVITAANVRIDQAADRERLEHTIAQLKPRLLVLDPFVRLHRIDENASGEVAPLLAYLRTLQRQHSSPCSSCITPKNPPAACAPARRCAARPSSMPGATRICICVATAPKLTLTVEHRAAPSPPAIGLELVSHNASLALQVLTSAPCVNPTATSIDERITAALIDASKPLSISQLRPLCRVRKATLCERLTALTAAGHLHRDGVGYRIATKP